MNTKLEESDPSEFKYLGYILKSGLFGSYYVPAKIEYRVEKIKFNPLLIEFESFDSAIKKQRKNR